MIEKEEAWKKRLREFGKMNIFQQWEKRKELLKLWKKLLLSNPTREDFRELLDGVMVVPEMLWDVWKGVGKRIST